MGLSTERERVIKALEKAKKQSEEYAQERIIVPFRETNMIIALLKEQETKTGKWILDDEDANSWECSECGGLLIINDGTPNENDWYFCPYCGSKLEEQAVKWNV